MTKTTVPEDPFPDPEGLVVPDSIPTRPPDNSTRIAEDEDPLATLPEEEAETIRRKKAAEASALTLEMVGDLPFANVRPPENVLFVCKLNPVTRDEDLELIFSRFSFECRMGRLETGSREVMRARGFSALELSDLSVQSGVEFLELRQRCECRDDAQWRAHSRCCRGRPRRCA